jgi:hypothetical protein
MGVSMFKKLLYQFLFWLTGTKIYLWCMKYVMPYIRFSFYYALPENKHFKQWGALERRGYRHLQPGDLIFTVDNKKLSTIIITSATKNVANTNPYFMPSHIALCVDKGSEFEIAEMTHLDYTKSTWEDVTRASTRVVIARVKDWDEKYINNTIIPMAKSFKNKKYDDRFEMGEASLACSELPYFADLERKAQVDLSPVVGDKPYITPVGWILGKNVEIIWDSNLETL